MNLSAFRHSFAFRLEDAFLALRRWKERVLDTAVSALFERPMRVLPSSAVAVAGVTILWFMKDGARHFVMLRESGRAFPFFPRCVGITPPQNDLAGAMRATMYSFFGVPFMSTLPASKIAIDTVAAAPTLFALTRDGPLMKTQALVWLVPIQPIQLELMKIPASFDLILMGETAFMSRGRDALPLLPPEIEFYQSIQRHLPKQKVFSSPVEDFDTHETSSAEETPPRSGRTLH